QRQQGAIRKRLDQAKVRKSFAQMRFVGFLAGAIDNQKKMAVEIRHHQIVEDAAGVVGELRVALSAWREREDVLWHQPLKRKSSFFVTAGFRGEPDLTHVRNIEQAA